MHIGGVIEFSETIATLNEATEWRMQYGCISTVMRMHMLRRQM